MSDEWEEYKKAKRESDAVTNKILNEIDKDRLLKNSGDAYARSILEHKEKKRK